MNWTSSVDELGDNEFLLTFNATLEDGWHIYSQNPGSDLVKPTVFLFEKGDDYELMGEVREFGKIIEVEDPLFDARVRKYAGNASFQIAVRTKKEKVELNGMAEYLTCSDKQCLKDSYEFSLKLLTTKTLSPVSDTFSANEQFKLDSQRQYANDDYTPPTANINIDSPVSANELGGLYNFEKEVDLNKEADKLVAGNLQNYLVDSTEPTKPAPKNAGGDIKPTANTSHASAKNNGQQKTATLADNRDSGAITNANLSSPRINSDISNILPNPVKWSTQMFPSGKSGIYDLIVKGRIDNGWHLYSKNNSLAGNPLPAQLKLQNTEGVEILDETVEVADAANLTNSGDPAFENKSLNRISKEVTYKTTVRFTDNVPVSGIIKYMAANGSKYLLPKEVAVNFNEDKSAIPAKKMPAGIMWAVGMGLALLGLGYYIRKTESEPRQAIVDEGDNTRQKES